VSVLAPGPIFCAYPRVEGDGLVGVATASKSDGRWSAGRGRLCSACQSTRDIARDLPRPNWNGVVGPGALQGVSKGGLHAYRAMSTTIKDIVSSTAIAAAGCSHVIFSFNSLISRSRC
jgi:hypothetical protein